MQPWAACHRSTVTNSQPAISARNLTLSLGTREAPVDILRGIDLDIARGSTVALLGPSGSGKSSLMAVLSGLERASGGSLQVAGADFATMDEDALAHARRGRIGIVLQAFHLLPTMTALENVATPMELAGADDAQVRARSELEAVGLGHRLDGRGLRDSWGRLGSGNRRLRHGHVLLGHQHLQILRRPGLVDGLVLAVVAH